MIKHGKNQEKTKADKSLIWMSVIYLLGLFIGAIDTGIITPARPIIQNQLGVDANLGIWMITIYTLTYAAIIPISGKLADKRGRKGVYLLSIALFGTGSLICAFSASFDSFLVLMLGRIVQASGAGGIMPVATAEFGTSFPEEKRGMALGLVGAVYGIANVLGASVGSAVLNIAGADQWQWIFLINIPICLFIVIAGIIVLPNNRAEETKAMDKLGTLLMTLIILALLYGLKNLDFFDFIPSFTSLKVWPFILGSVLLIPLFVKVERKAEDPIFHIEYASNRQIMVTLLLGIVVGCSMMGMIFIPQFSENCLKIPSGSGGYFVIILGFCSGGASMMSGKMIDKRGAKPVMALGFITTIIGCLYLSFIAVKFVNLFNVVISLVIIGFGLGLTMGTPLNYMMLQNTSDEESNSALATLSLVRSIGTAVAPAIMVGFIVHAAGGLQTTLMDTLPEMPAMPAFEHQAELDSIVAQLKEANADDPDMIEMLSSMDKMGSMDMDMSSMDGEGMEIPPEILEGLQNADVTTITDETKNMVGYMLSEDGGVVSIVQGGIGEGIDGIGEGIDGIGQGINGMQSGIDEMEAGKAELQKGIDGISQGIAGMEQGLAQQDEVIAAMEQILAGDIIGGIKRLSSIDASGAPEGMGDNMSIADIAKLPQKLNELKAARAELAQKIEDTKAQRAEMENALKQMSAAQDELRNSQQDAKAQQALMLRAQTLMAEIRDQMPEYFDGIKDEYMAAIDENSEEIEAVYQSTLNTGYRNMYLFLVAVNVLGLALLALYKEEKRKAEIPAAQ